jgi:tetratricopeptide (TPR) repeat protein
MSFPLPKTETPPCDRKQNTIWYFLFILLLFACYYNSFQAGWHFDDVANIVLNTPLHISDLSPETLKQTFFAYPDNPDKFTRPVSNLTFALNWFFGQDRVFGYHLVNFIIHVLTTLFLYHSCLLLLETPAINKKYDKCKFFIAGLAAILWAVNPIQTQAITYIVQRMASLATLFYLSGIWCYLKARISPETKNRKPKLWYFGTILSFLLAVGSKENAVVFPASIILIELIFFQQSIRFTKRNILLLVAGFFLISIFTLLLVGPGFFTGIANTYEGRDFTLWQRILTEARIVVFYLSLLFYPSPLRLSITHDVQLSSALLSPPSTLLAVLFLTALTILPFFYHKKFPFLSFAILFFLLNHIIESTFIPLELVFEHRNYLPSLFLFLPLAAAVGLMLQKYQQQSKMVYMTIVSGCIVVIIFLSLGTIARNNVWLTERTLWADSLKKAPQAARSYINLAHGYLFQDKNYKKAFELNFLSLEKYSPTPWKDKLRAYNNLAYIMTQVGNYKEAFTFYDKALAASQATPDSSLHLNLIFQKAKVQRFAGQTAPAMAAINKLVQAKPTAGNYQQMYGELLILSGQEIDGIGALRQALLYATPQSLEYKTTLLDLALVFTRQNVPGVPYTPNKAEVYINFAQRLNSPFIATALCVMEYSIRTKQTPRAERALRALLSQLSLPQLVAIVEERSPDRPTLPLDYPLLRQYLSDWLASQEEK